MSSPLSTHHAPVQAFLAELHARFAGLSRGQVATYIPELAKADPAWFGIAIATVDGQVYEVGDTRQPFTLQSVSKPLVYGLALEDRGRAGVERIVGTEPSGDAFNSISLEPGTGRPRNPMINAGAIAISSLIEGASPAQRSARILDTVSRFAGRPLGIDAAVCESERSTGHRNRAIGHLLRNHGIIADDPEPALQLYFEQCSVLVDCRDLALIAATLANAGVNPVTQQRAVRSEFIDAMLSVMTTCGMYDYSGEWVYRVGLPAKSGVGGGIIAVLPGQLGIGVFSPLLDERGNSARGVQVCEALSHGLGLHFLQPPRPASSSLRARYDLAGVRSKRRRSAAEAQVLNEHGHRTRVYELQGDLHFATVEPVLRDITAAGEALQHAVIDFERVRHVDAAAVRMLERLVDSCAPRGQHLVLTRVRRDLLPGFGHEMNPRHARAASFHPQLDFGLEWCERQLLQRHAAPPASPSLASLAEHRLCAGAGAEDLQHLEALLDTHRFDAGSLILRTGDPAERLFFLVRGEVSVVTAAVTGVSRRLSTLSAGMGFGEAALLSGGVRTADVRADTQVECRTLTAEAFAGLAAARPSLMICLLRNLLQSSAETTQRLTLEVAALSAPRP
ncbi:MAG: glutaminase A [Rubrivivax sp.]|nr:glutaminase A [Rubrivivax sp.]